MIPQRTLEAVCEISTGTLAVTKLPPLFTGEDSALFVQVTLKQNGSNYSPESSVVAEMYLYFPNTENMTMAVPMNISGNVISGTFPAASTGLDGYPLLVIQLTDTFTSNVIVAASYQVKMTKVRGKYIVSTEAPNPSEVVYIGRSPYVDPSTGNWFEWNTSTGAYVDTGVHGKGDKGDKGDTGKSAYELAVEGGYSGTKAQFEAGLVASAEYASNARASASAASASAQTATTKASEAASSASTATTKASEAATSATNAAGSASTASTKASAASASASSASTSATTATTKANEASSSASSAATSASTATTKASEASTSATNAAGSATTASTKASEASTSATAASNSAKDSEAYAVGKRGGTDVTSSDVTYHNNSKYYAEQSQEFFENMALDAVTVTGNPINVAVKRDQVAKQTLVTLEPQQDLHGYDHPWPGGAGKNLLPMELDYLKSINFAGIWNGNVYTYNGLTFTVNVDNADNVLGITVNGTVSTSADFYLFINKSITADESLILTGCPANGSTSTYFIAARRDSSWTNRDVGSGYTMANAYPITDMIIGIRNSTTISNLTFYPMLRLASVSDATFEPYTNICPVTGIDLLEMTVSGTNVDDVVMTKAMPETVYGGTLDLETGKLVIDRVGIRLADLTYENVDTQYSIKRWRSRDNALLSDIYVAGTKSTEIISDTFRSLHNSESLSEAKDGDIYLILGNGTNTDLYIEHNCDSAADFITYLGDSMAYFRLKSDKYRTIYLTPDYLELFQNAANVSTNAASISVTYTVGEIETVDSTAKVSKELKTLHGLVDMLINRETEMTWKDYQGLVNSRYASKLYPVGSQLIDTWTLDDGNTEYECPWDIVHYDDQDNAFLKWHWSIPNNVQFDAPEAIYYAGPNGLPAGQYYITIGTAYGTGWVAGNTINFTLQNAMSEGDQLFINCGTNNANNPASRAFSVFAKGSTTAKETGTTTSGTTGTSLGTIGDINAHRTNGQLNAISRVVYGSGRWSESAVRQYLNSTAAAGVWWAPQNPWDRPPTQLSTLRGFLAGCSADFRSILKPVKVATILNTVQGFDSDYEITEDKIFLPSLQQLYIEPYISGLEGEEWDYYKALAAEAGLSGRFQKSSTYEILKAYSIAAHTAAVVSRLRSCVRTNATSTWCVNTSGGVYGSGACIAYGGWPACKILKS